MEPPPTSTKGCLGQRRGPPTGCPNCVSPKIRAKRSDCRASPRAARPHSRRANGRRPRPNAARPVDPRGSAPHAHSALTAAPEARCACSDARVSSRGGLGSCTCDHPRRWIRWSCANRCRSCSGLGTRSRCPAWTAVRCNGVGPRSRGWSQSSSCSRYSHYSLRKSHACDTHDKCRAPVHSLYRDSYCGPCDRSRFDPFGSVTCWWRYPSADFLDLFMGL